MRLRHAPAMVTRPCPATWSYVVCYHTRSGTLAASIEVTAQAGGAATETFTVREALRWDDTTIENANPRIGLRADSLNLPSDRTIRDNLLRSASSQAAVKIIASVLKARIARVRAEAARASSEGNSVEALEATVDLAHLVGWSDARGGRHMLDALHAGHKSQALGGAPGNVTLILPSPRPAPSSALSRTGPDK